MGTCLLPICVTVQPSTHVHLIVPCSFYCLLNQERRGLKFQPKTARLNPSKNEKKKKKWIPFLPPAVLEEYSKENIKLTMKPLFCLWIFIQLSLL